MSNNIHNAAVNPVVVSDFSSNAEGRRYNSTTDDLLDRIREGVDKISKGGDSGIATVSSHKEILPMWTTISKEGVAYSFYSNVFFSIDKNNNIESIRFITGDQILNLPVGYQIIHISPKPFCSFFYGRLDGSMSIIDTVDFNAYLLANLPTKRNLKIVTEAQNIFSLEIVVLPNSLLQEEILDNYFEVITNGTSRKYYLDSFNGIPIVNRIMINDFTNFNIEEIIVQPQPGIMLEYQIKATFPGFD